MEIKNNNVNVKIIVYMPLSIFVTLLIALKIIEMFDLNGIL